MVQPGSLASHFPPGEDYVNRQLAAIRAGATEQVAAQVTALTGTVRRLAGMVDQLAELVNAQVATATMGANSGTAATIPTSWGVACSGSILVPQWATTCSVMASGSAEAATSSAGVGSLSSYLTIAGHNGIVRTTNTSTSDLIAITVPMHERTFAVTPGSRIDVRLTWQRSNHVLTGFAIFGVVAVFTR